ncbi:hypothetical protein AVEN_247270-1 [Araneus ventricosus]|uniref:Uncharacterized protein n=1 Tax=Araneus ventricosus TaxID=182803 RepID=A0A4Y2TQL8_ARAVE|nr:hypothetical protein AVEN_247270-1 [Araneus ventricosus]
MNSTLTNSCHFSNFANFNVSILWATSRVSVDGAELGSDVRASRCPEQKTRWNRVRDVLTTLAFSARSKDDYGSSKTYLMTRDGPRAGQTGQLPMAPNGAKAGV